MSEIRLNNGKVIGDRHSPYIIAELNTSHFGDIEMAKKMIQAAKVSGCDCVKFQSWDETSLYSKKYLAENAIIKRFVNKFSLSESELVMLSEYCQDIKIDFASTPYSEKEADFLLEKCETPFIKIASMDLVNIPYLEYLSTLDTALILSTGMGTMSDIERAVNILSSKNSRICILHCVSLYPTTTENQNLNNIIGLRRNFEKIPIGFSDHSLGIHMSIAAIALGSSIIEKHFTLDNSKIGMDNQMAINQHELSDLVAACRNVKSGLGEVKRTLKQAEIDQRLSMYRSAYAKKFIEKGTRLRISDLEFKRPGDGIYPNKIYEFVGKIISENINEGELITKDMFYN